MKLFHLLYSILTKYLIHFVMIFAGISGTSLLLMMLVTVTDIILRIFGYSIPGAYDVVSICAGISIACGLPYTTAIKGHVAIEFFYQKLPFLGRAILDTGLRIISIILFSFLAKISIEYGLSLKNSGEVTPTLEIPIFWLPWLISISSILMCLVIFHNMLHPGKEMIKP